ncbi:glycosyltransferase [Lactobacillus gallinarum]|uniref:glycosyltransferase n=1 Tax=Lactobacillus gallinarum TaxID=52242 RepID=UPI0024B17EF6|nr:glycosyltransferase [Lactobacillus gallinarum]
MQIDNTHRINLVMFEDKFGLGGIETFITNVCSKIDRNTFNVEVVVVNKITSQYDELFKKLGINLVVLVPEIELNPLKRFQKGLVAFKKYLSEKSKVTSIIHFNISDSIDLLYVRLAKNNGVKVRIAHSHNSSATSTIKKIAHKMGMIFLANTPNYYFTCSKLAARWLFPKKIYSNKQYFFIRNAINTHEYAFDPQKRKELRSKYGWTNNLVLAEVGRFNKQKNHRFLLQVFKETLKIKPNAILVLVGAKDCLYEDIKRYAKDIGIDDKVMFLGKSSEVADLLQAFDIFMLPSLYEGLPFVLVESQAASLPSLVSDTVTNEIKLTKYVKFESLKNDPKIWAHDVISMDSIKRVADREEMIQQGYDLNTMVRSLEKLYLKFYKENN